MTAVAQNISIGTARHVDLIRAGLGRELKSLEGEGLKVQLQERPAGRYTFLSCQVTSYGKDKYKGKDKEALFRYRVARFLSELILDQWEKLLVEEMIRENYYYFNEEERRNIFEYTLGYIGHPAGGVPGQGQIFRSRLKRAITEKIMDFLRQHNQIIIEGFIRFRLKEYVDELQQAIERAVDDFLMEREYREFIQLLRYFVEIQESRVDLVHVLIHPGGVFHLLDERAQVISNESLEGLIMELVDGKINNEDMLISALITLAPRQVVFHCAGTGEHEITLKTIRGVFYGRVRECQGCPLCRKE
ncbi:MAG: putative sporulation protein YtxC [Thermoanaerobacteraceae bacterium]|nr:putative sporulation protein YtxC [Thermoanaerobacteraceae bacterium]